MKLAAVCLVTCLAVAAQEPRVTNAKLETRTATRGLGAEIAAVRGIAWVGYSAPAQNRNHNSCCWGRNGCGCSLEEDGGRTVREQASAGPVKLEGSSLVSILFRVTDGKVGKIQAHSLSCDLDAGGMSFVWLTGIQPADGVAFLEGLVKTNEQALVGLALQGDPSADAALVRIAKEEQNSHRRGQALFWLANKASDKAVPAIDAALANDPDTAVKRQAVFAVSQLPKDEGVPKLIELARSHKNPAVRKQAMFWLGQSNDPRALNFLEQILLR